MVSSKFFFFSKYGDFGWAFVFQIYILSTVLSPFLFWLASAKNLQEKKKNPGWESSYIGVGKLYY